MSNLNLYHLKRTVIFKAESSQENKIQKLQKNIKWKIAFFFSYSQPVLQRTRFLTIFLFDCSDGCPSSYKYYAYTSFYLVGRTHK